MATRRFFLAVLAIVFALAVSACNLAGAPSEEQIAETATAAVTTQPSRTPASTSGVPTTFPVTQPTPLPSFTFPTAVVVVPTAIQFPTSVPPAVFPTNTPLPVSIVILSPVPGNVVAGNVQILGSASHPQFLQYQVEYGPDPNPGNLWFPATSAITNPVLNGLLGIWNTNTVQDSRYQLRLRVYLRDGTLLTTVIPNITVQNRINTPIPSPTQNIPRPIAAFSQDRAVGDVPLTVQFINQSSGTINAISWNFGDGNSSNEVNPRHTFGAPGLYTVTLSVSGPGGSSNVSRQINATSPTAPVAGFTQDRIAGIAPLTVQFTDQSSGNISTRLWFFSDGSTSTERNPAHTFNVPGTYNVFLTVTGPGGSSSVTRQINVTSSIPPTATPTATFTPTWTFTPTFTPTNTTTVIPPTLTFTPTATFTPTWTFTPTFTPTFTDTPTNTTTVIPPTLTFTPTATFTPTFTDTATVVPPTLTFTPTFTLTFTPTPTNTPVPPPQAFFSASVVQNNPLAVQFTDESSGQVVARLWEFGDGTTSAEQNPLHTYAAGGDYTVTLTVADALAQTTSYSLVVSVSAPVQANFAAQPNGLNVQFVNQSTGPVTTFLWEFGDGTTSAEQNPLHTYGAGGTYTVTLTVGDANGRTSSTSQQVSVTQPVQASFTAQPNGLTVQFVNQSTGPVASYLWSFGDGGSSSEQNPAHTYAAGGTCTVTLTVTGTNGGSNNTSQQVSVTQPVQANFSAQPSGLTVQFVDQSTGPIASYLWDFGDGGSSSEQNPAHTYAAGGTYTVTLTVTGTSGSSNNASQQVSVTQPVQASFTAQVSDLNVQFIDQSTGQILSYAWVFGDGSSSSEQNPAHTYAAGGTYTVTLTVTGTNGASNTANQQVTVTAALHAEFSAQPSDLNVQFVDQSTGQIVAYQWDFGDGSGSNEQNPLHGYNAGGTYTVTLTITGSNGGTNSISHQVTVAAAIQANFSAQPNGLNVQFVDQSTGQIVAYQWDFKATAAARMSRTRCTHTRQAARTP
ncbi:MAG: PKD domain-containing protein [Anaerolineae bacterium]